MNEFGVRQIKLVTGDEIVCEIVDWLDTEIQVRKVLKISNVTIIEDSENVYAFRPWMTYSTDFDEILSINPLSIVATCDPSYIMEVQYYEGLDIMRKYMSELEKSYKAFNQDNQELKLDSSSDNVVSMFRDDDTIH